MQNVTFIIQLICMSMDKNINGLREIRIWMV